MSLDPPKELLNIPPVSVEIGNLQCGECGVVREKDIGRIRYGVSVLHAAEWFWVFLARCWDREAYRLITADTS